MPLHRKIIRASENAFLLTKSTTTMEQFLSIFVLVYFLIYFGITFVFKSILVAKRIGKNPIVLPQDDSAYGLIGRYFKIIIGMLFLYVLLNAIIPSVLDTYFLPIAMLNKWLIKYIGFAFLAFALVWTIVAQNHMKNSWRIGIDTEKQTELITTGLFRFSRNPIFLGMLASLMGLFLIMPNCPTCFFLVIGYMLIQVQIRLEEEFLLKQHGDEYLAYKQQVRRFL